MIMDNISMWIRTEKADQAPSSPSKSKEFEEEINSLGKQKDPPELQGTVK